MRRRSGLAAMRGSTRLVMAVIPALALMSWLSTVAAQTIPATAANPVASAANATMPQSGPAGSSATAAQSATGLPSADGVAVAGLTPPVPAASSDHLADYHLNGARVIDGANRAALANPLNWAVHVHKARHEVEVYYRGHFYKTYHAVFGRSRWAGAKEWEGDGRTPEGAYLIVGKHPSYRFRWFLHLNYPNALDQTKFGELRAAREIPAALHEGGQIGIHGTDNPSLNDGNINWTTGCISLDNRDISELARLLPVGTLVVIEP